MIKATWRTLSILALSIAMLGTAQAITRQNALESMLEKMCRHCVLKDERAKTASKKELELYAHRMAQAIIKFSNIKWSEEQAKALQDGTLKVENYGAVKQRYAALNVPEMPEVNLVWIKAAQNKKLTELQKQILKDGLPFFEREFDYLWKEALDAKALHKLLTDKEWIIRRDAARVNKYFIVTSNREGHVTFKIELSILHAKVAFGENGKVTFSDITIEKNDIIPEELSKELDTSTKNLKTFLSDKTLEFGVLQNDCISIRAANSMYLAFGKERERIIEK